MTHSDLMILAMPLVAVLAVALIGAAVVYQATRRAAKTRMPRRLAKDDLQAGIASGRFPVLLLSKQELEAYGAFLKDRPHAAE